MALRDHDYAAPADYEEEVVGVPNFFLHDHNYIAQMPFIQIGQEEGNGAAQDEIIEEENDEDEEGPVQEGPIREGAAADVVVREPETFRALPGVQLNSKFYVDNLGYKYYKKKLLISTISLVCERQRNPSHPRCHGSASISRNEMDNRISIKTAHNHEPEALDLDVPFLRNALGEKGVDRTSTTTSIRGLYNREIIR